MREIFKDIPGYEGYYQVSNLGNVKSLERISNGRKFKNKSRKKILSGGYYTVVLCVKSEIKTFRVANLVAMAFLGHVPNGYKVVVDHINNIKTDDRLENLQLISARLNCSKDRKNGLSKFTGVTYKKSHNKWMAQIQINGKSVFLGHYNSEKEASEAYQSKLKSINYE